MLVAKNIMLVNDTYFARAVEELSGSPLASSLFSILKSNYDGGLGVCFYTSSLNVIPVKKRSTLCKYLTIATDVRSKNDNSAILVLFVKGKDDNLKSTHVCSASEIDEKLRELVNKNPAVMPESINAVNNALSCYTNAIRPSIGAFTSPVLTAPIKIQEVLEEPEEKATALPVPKQSTVSVRQEKPDEDFYLGDATVLEGSARKTGVIPNSQQRFFPSLSNSNDFFIDNPLVGVISSRIILPKNWSSAMHYGTYTLRMYLVSIEYRVQLELKSSVVSSTGSYIVDLKTNTVVYNTGLLTKTGDYVLILAELGKVGLMHRRICERTEYMRVFGKESNIVPVRLYSSKSDLIFSGEFGAFDFSDWSQMLHCVQDRRNRFPSKYKDFTDDALALDIVNAVRYSLMLQTNDYTYIKPFFVIKENRVGYLIPYHIANNVNDPCELYLVAVTRGESWKIMTVLSVEQAENNASFFTPYSGM